MSKAYIPASGLTGKLRRIAARSLARAPLPMKARVLGLKLYRAGIGAKAL